MNIHHNKWEPNFVARRCIKKEKPILNLIIIVQRIIQIAQKEKLLNQVQLIMQTYKLIILRVVKKVTILRTIFTENTNLTKNIHLMHQKQ